MKKYRQVTEKEFNRIKPLLDAGAKISDLIKLGLTTRSDATLTIFKRASSFEDYQRINREYLEKSKQKKEQKNGVSADTLTPVTNDIQFYAQIIELLAQINKRVAVIEESMQEKPRRGLFN